MTTDYAWPDIVPCEGGCGGIINARTGDGLPECPHGGRDLCADCRTSGCLECRADAAEDAAVGL